MITKASYKKSSNFEHIPTRQGEILFGLQPLKENPESKILSLLYLVIVTAQQQQQLQ